MGIYSPTLVRRFISLLSLSNGLDVLIFFQLHSSNLKYVNDSSHASSIHSDIFFDFFSHFLVYRFNRSLESAKLFVEKMLLISLAISFRWLIFVIFDCAFGVDGKNSVAMALQEALLGALLSIHYDHLKLSIQHHKGHETLTTPKISPVYLGFRYLA